MLTTSNLVWAPQPAGGGIPHKAVYGGTQEGVPLYICQCVIGSSTFVGKLYTAEDLCYVPWHDHPTCSPEKILVYADCAGADCESNPGRCENDCPIA